MTQTSQERDGVRTFTGADLHELLPQIKAQLGEDAIILARRDGTTGGLGGFFARRTVEVDAIAAARQVDVRDDDDFLGAEPGGPAGYGLDAYAAAQEPAGNPAPHDPGSSATVDAAAPQDAPAGPGAPRPADAAAALDAAAAALRAAAARAAEGEVVPGEAPDTAPARIPPQEAAAFAEQLAALMGDRPPAAPAHRPTTDPRVDAIPAVSHDAGAVDPDSLYDRPFPLKDEASRAAEPSPAPRPGEPVAEPGVHAPRARPERAALETTVHRVLPPAPAPGADLDDAGALVQPSVAPDAVAPRLVVPDPASGLGPDGAELLATGLSPALAAELVHAAGAHVTPLAQDTSPRGVLRTALASRIPVHMPQRGAGGAVIGFVGPGGSGKTRCVARLATAYARRSSLPVAVIALRPADDGAELAALLGPAGVLVHPEHDATAAAARVEALRAGTIVLLDTPAVSPRAEDELRALAADLHRLAPDELHLTVPATMGSLAAREVAAAGRRLGACGIALTHADETAALGTVVELAIDTDLPLSYVARGVEVDRGMRPAAADALAFAMLGPIDPADELV